MYKRKLKSNFDWNFLIGAGIATVAGLIITNELKSQENRTAEFPSKSRKGLNLLKIGETCKSPVGNKDDNFIELYESFPKYSDNSQHTGIDIKPKEGNIFTKINSVLVGTLTAKYYGQSMHWVESARDPKFDIVTQKKYFPLSLYRYNNHKREKIIDDILLHNRVNEQKINPGNFSFNGNSVSINTLINGTQEFRLTYKHLSQITNEKVKKYRNDSEEQIIIYPGEEIGLMGNTGQADGYHLHLSVETWVEIIPEGIEKIKGETIKNENGVELTRIFIDPIYFINNILNA
jgi:hypothetical protein